MREDPLRQQFFYDVLHHMRRNSPRPYLHAMGDELGAIVTNSLQKGYKTRIDFDHTPILTEVQQEAVAEAYKILFSKATIDAHVMAFREFGSTNEAIVDAYSLLNERFEEQFQAYAREVERLVHEENAPRLN